MVVAGDDHRSAFVQAGDEHEHQVCLWVQGDLADLLGH